MTSQADSPVLTERAESSISEAKRRFAVDFERATRPGHHGGANEDPALAACLHFGAAVIRTIIQQPFEFNAEQAVRFSLGLIRAVVNERAGTQQVRPAPEFLVDIEERLRKWLGTVDPITGDQWARFARFAPWRDPLETSWQVPDRVRNGTPQEVHDFQVGWCERRFREAFELWEKTCAQVDNSTELSDPIAAGNILLADVSTYLGGALAAMADFLLDSGFRGTAALSEFDRRSGELIQSTLEFKLRPKADLYGISSYCEARFDSWCRNSVADLRESFADVVWDMEIELGPVPAISGLRIQVPEPEVHLPEVELPNATKSRRGRPSSAPDLHPEIGTFLQEVTRFTGRTVTFRDYAIVAGYRDETLLKAYRRGDPKRATAAHGAKFQAVLRQTPCQFLESLDSARR